jgi:hypothetical protein
MPSQGVPAGGGTGRPRLEADGPPTGQTRDRPPQTDDTIIGSYLAREGTPARVRDAWKRVQAQRGDGGKSEEIRGLQRDVAHIKQLLTQPKPTTYAQAAAAESVPIRSRAEREIIIAPGLETTEQKGRNGRELVEEFQRRGGVDVVAARRLRSGDILVTAKSKEARVQLQQSEEWTKGAGEGAEARRKRFTVIAHGIKRAQLDPKDQAKAIWEILAQNPRWKGRVTILSIAWATKERLGGPPTAPLIINVAESDQGDFIIDEGLIWNYQIHDCEPFSGNCKVTQCFKCYKYGHIARVCSYIPTCGFCGGKEHRTDDCPRKATPTCSNCPGRKGHTAWSAECPIRQEKKRQARKAYDGRPRRFLPKGQSPTTLEPTPTAPTQSRKRPATEETGWTIATRGRGRPSGLQEAAKSSRTLESLWAPSTSRTSSEEPPTITDTPMSSTNEDA